MGERWGGMETQQHACVVWVCGLRFRFWGDRGFRRALARASRHGAVVSNPVQRYGFPGSFYGLFSVRPDWTFIFLSRVLPLRSTVECLVSFFS